MNKALFLDRDGVINRMVKYDEGYDSPQKPEDVKLVKGIENIIRFANMRKIPVVEVSNQPGVAKGKMNKVTSDAIEKRIHTILNERGAYIDFLYICPHHPDAIISDLKIDCDCRKPKPGLLLKAAKDFNINLSESVMLGDKASDVQAGRSAGCKTIIFIHNQDLPQKVEEAKKSNADFIIYQMSKALSILQTQFE